MNPLIVSLEIECSSNIKVMGRKTLGDLPVWILMGQREQFDTHWMREFWEESEIWDSADYFKINFTLISSLTCYFSISGNILCEHSDVLLTLTLEGELALKHSCLRVMCLSQALFSWTVMSTAAPSKSEALDNVWMKALKMFWELGRHFWLITDFLSLPISSLVTSLDKFVSAPLFWSLFIKTPWRLLLTSLYSFT